jgi:hypothetical protein
MIPRGSSTFRYVLWVSVIVGKKKVLLDIAGNSIKAMLFDRLNMRHVLFARYTLNAPSSIKIEFRW